MAIVADLSGNAPLNKTPSFVDQHIPALNQNRAGKAVAVTLSDSLDLAGGPTLGFMCDTGGTIKLTMADRTTQTIDVDSMVYYPLSVIRFWSTGAGVAGVHAYY